MDKKTIILIFAASFLVTILLYFYSSQEKENTNIPNRQVLSFEECADMPGSVIQEGFPSVCLTEDGLEATKPITEEEEEQLIENLDTSQWEEFENELVGLMFSYPHDWGNPSITSNSSRDQVELNNNLTITKGVYYTNERDRILETNEFIEQNTPNRRIVTNYELAGEQIKRASYDYSSNERAELLVFPADQYGEILSIFFHYTKSDLNAIREYFGVLSTVQVIDSLTPSPTVSEDQTSGGCIVTGCSSQVCAEEEVITDCAYKEEYACYETATCERQENGECGWTMTGELQSCLEDS